MELAYRKGKDVFVPAGAYKELEARLGKNAPVWAEIPAVVMAAFDRSTRLLPFLLYDQLIFPCGTRQIAASLHQSGFTRTRAVFQLWNPNFRPTHAQIDGRNIQMLLVSSMQLHSRGAYNAIRQAWSMGEDRPLILVGGPKAVYEPYHFWQMKDRNHGLVAPDVVVTGESYVLLDLMNVLAQYHRPGEHIRKAFERARREGALDSVPGLVFLDPQASLEEPVLVDTGLQRLVQHLDELPHEVIGYRLMEPPHKEKGLAPAPLRDSKIGKHVRISSVVITQGCKFNCSYCPIPAYNQKTWRFRSPEGIAHEMKSIAETFGIEYFFGTDDNFFNRRDTVEEILGAMARTKVDGREWRRRIRWSTEATQFDTYKNRDLLPLAHAAGLYAVWFGIEDLTAELINKGQKPEVTIELFKLLHQHRISPMAMVMFHDKQPFHTKDSIYGITNQAEFLRKAGAISFQCTVHNPAVGTREVENTYNTGRVLKTLGNKEIADSMYDGNHVMVVVGDEPPWRRQLKLLGAYASFYNPLNFLRAFKNDGSLLRRRRIGWQVAGMVALAYSAIKEIPFIFRLMGQYTTHDKPPELVPLPVRNPKTAQARLHVPELEQIGLRKRESAAA